MEKDLQALHEEYSFLLALYDEYSIKLKLVGDALKRVFDRIEDIQYEMIGELGVEEYRKLKSTEIVYAVEERLFPELSEDERIDYGLYVQYVRWRAECYSQMQKILKQMGPRVLVVGYTENADVSWYGEE